MIIHRLSKRKDIFCCKLQLCLLHGKIDLKKKYIHFSHEKYIKSSTEELKALVQSQEVKIKQLATHVQMLENQMDILTKEYVIIIIILIERNKMKQRSSFLLLVSVLTLKLFI